MTLVAMKDDYQIGDSDHKHDRFGKSVNKNDTVIDLNMSPKVDAHGVSLTARQRYDITRSQNRLSGGLEKNISMSSKVDAHGNSMICRQRPDIMRSQNRFRILEENIDPSSIGPQHAENVHDGFCIKTQMSLLSA